MNYNKKRKRQSGRQARKVQDCYSIWIDDVGKINYKLHKAIPVSHTGFAYMKSVTKEEFAKDFT